MNAQDIAALQQIVTSAMQNAETINKVWIAGAAVVASFIAVLVGACVQIYISRVTRRVAATALKEQLQMHELSSRRVAAANVAAKRQDWIDELRKDIATYLSLWQNVTLYWAGLADEFHGEPDSVLDGDEYQRRLQEVQELVKNTRSEFGQARFRIELRLNHSESEHKELSRLLAKSLTMQEKLRDSDTNQKADVIAEELKVHLRQCLNLAQKILKDEWTRVKREIYVNPEETIIAQSRLT